MHEYGGADGRDDGGDGSSGSGEEGLVGALRKMAAGRAAAPGLRLPRLRGLSAAPPKEGGGDKPETAEPDLEEDPLTLRPQAKRARERAAEAEAAPAPAPARREAAERAAFSYEELRRRVQVDLNREENLSDLEDPQLAEHMRRRREERVAHEAARAALPQKESLKREDTAGRRALSALTTRLKEQQMTLQCASDEVHAHATNVGRYAAGGQPHGYPPVTGPPGPVLEHLQKKLLAAVEDFNGVLAALEEFERDLALARRHYEAAVDGLGRWCEFYEPAPVP